ncbi:MAG TPA: ABC transporter substrate-binding protein [Chloroflexota bacterium]|nr:ABC transporter substrate-binding protein [Chloroflexota bacterium]
MIVRVAMAVLAAMLLWMPGLPLAAAPAEQGKGALPLRLVVFTVAPALAAARDRGYLAAERLDVSIDTTNNSTDQMQGFAAGRWDVVHTLFDNLLAYADRAGVQSVAFAVTDIRDLSLYAQPEITSYGDLRGRPVAVDAPDTAVALVLRRLLLAHGLDVARGDYELVPAGGQQLRLQALLRGEAAAAMLGPPDSTTAARAGLRRLGHHSEVIPDYPGLTLAARDTWLADPGHRDAVVRLLRAWQRGAAWVTDPANREAAIAQALERSGGSREGALAQLDAVATDLALSPAGLAAVRDLRVELGLTPPPGPVVERFYDLSLVEQARR